MNSHSCLGAILMAFAPQRLPDDPILIATFNVPIEQHLKSLDTLHAEIDGFVRRTLDLRCSDFSVWIEEYRSGTRSFSTIRRCTCS